MTSWRKVGDVVIQGARPPVVVPMAGDLVFPALAERGMGGRSVGARPPSWALPRAQADAPLPHLALTGANTSPPGQPQEQTPFLHFFSMGMVPIPVSCTMSQTSVHISSVTLSSRSNPLNLFVTSTV